MPGNEVADGIYSLYELDNSSRGQHLSQAFGGSWSALDYNQWVRKPAHIGAAVNFNWKNSSFEELGTIEGHAPKLLNAPLYENYSQLTPRPEYHSSLTLNNLPIANDFCLRNQNSQCEQNLPGIFDESTHADQQILTSKGFPIPKLQHESECVNSPTLTTNSDRSEITEASSDFNFLRGQQNFAKDQELTAGENYLMQQPGYNDMQSLQQHMMFKQLQEFQRQQQLGDLRQQNSLNQFSTISRQATGGQFSPLINGTPVNDASQMVRNWMQRGASPVAQGLPHKNAFSQEQGQVVRSVAINPQQFDVSVYGAPISSNRVNMSQFPQLQGLPHESINLLAKASGQVQKSMMQPAGFGIPYVVDQPTVPDVVGLSQGALMSKPEIQMKNNFGQIPVQDLNSGVLPGSLQDANAQQVTASVKELSGRHDQAGWPAMQQMKQVGSSQGLVPLDPMEAKILYNMDDNIWDAFGGRLDTDAVGLGNNPLENSDAPFAFPSLNSGSWSALMQSAVAEASSNDTGLQEEWSGSTFHNSEHSTENQLPNFVDSEKQPMGWFDNNLQGTSLVTDPTMSSTFPGFQQPAIQSSIEQREDVCRDGSHKSVENHNSQHKSSDNAWSEQMFEYSQSALQHQKGSSSNVSLDKGSKSLVKAHHHLMNNVPSVAFNTYEGANGTHEIQQNYLQRENSSDCSRGPSSHEQGHIEQFKFFGDFSSSERSVDKASLPDFQGSPRASEELPSGGDHGSDVTGQTSEHMLELLHKVDQSKEDGTIKQFGSTDCNLLAEMYGADSRDTSFAQMYAQSSASQGFGLRLAPPSQRLVNSNNFLSSPGLTQTRNNLNSGQLNPEFGEKNQVLFSPSSVQSLPHAHELAQRAHWDKKSDTVVQTGFSQHVDMGANAVAPFLPNGPNFAKLRNQLQMHQLSNVPATSESSQAALHAAGIKFPPFSQAPSQDGSRQMHNNADNQQFPVLDAMPKSQPPNISVVSQHGDDSTRPYNVWRNVPTQPQPFGKEPLKFSNSPSSMGPQRMCDQNSLKGMYKSSEVGASSNSQGSDHTEGHPGKEMLQQQISSKVFDSSRLGVSHGQEPVSDMTAVTSGEVENLSLPAEASEGLAVNPQTALQSKPSQEMAIPNDSHAQSTNNSVLSNHTEHGHVNLQVGHSWFKQFGALRNGQMAPTFDARLSTAAALQLSRGKPSQSLQSHIPLERSDAPDAGSRFWLSTESALVASQQLSSPFVLPSEVANQMAAMRPKKRKTMTCDLLPWHKEVTQPSKRLQNISLAEHDWAQATNRLIEKVENAEVTEDLQPLHRSKRRLILTTQLVQQLFRPAPGSVCSADAASNYGIVSYYVSRSSLGDACSLACSTRNDFLKSVNDDTINSEIPKVSEQRSDQRFVEVAEEFIKRTNNLDSVFQRLDKTASVVDIRAEFQELERIAVINRFAKFHVRGQVDASGTSSSSAPSKAVPQRHVLAFPMPRNLPEGVQCLSL